MPSPTPLPRPDRLSPPPAFESAADTSSAEARKLVLGLIVLLRYRFLIAVFALILPLLTAGVSLLVPRTYTSTSSFVPQTRTTTSNLAGLAAQFGMSVGNSDAAQSPVFYAQIITSREILGSLGARVFDVPGKGGAVRRDTLARLIAPKKLNPLERNATTLDWLRRVTAASPAARTGIVTVGVTTQSPRLSYELNSALLSELNRFNLETRKSQATSERAFTQRRMEEVAGELRVAENRLQSFMESNRQYMTAPQLRFEFDRLTRDVTFKQELSNSLVKAFEEAKIEEVRDTPVFTVIEPADFPVRPNSRGTVRRVILALILGLGFGVAVAFTRNFFSPLPPIDDPYAELARLRRHARNDLFHPLRALRRLLARESNPAREGRAL